MNILSQFLEEIMKESAFQASLRHEIEDRLPGAVVMKSDSSCIQGIPDLLILYKKNWAALEVKNKRNARHQPNQDFYVEKLNEMSFSSFIFPENKEEVLNAMEQALTRGTRRRSRVSGSK